mgnify:CR=1 FL=1
MGICKTKDLYFTQIPVGIACISDDNKKMYVCAEYYNEIYEVDLLNNTTKSLGKILGENDDVQLFFEMIYYDNKIILIPRNAKNICIMDIKTKEQVLINKNKLVNNADSIGFITYINDNFLYLVYRMCLQVFRINMDTYTIETIHNAYETENVMLYFKDQNDDLMISYSAQRKSIFIFEKYSNSIREFQIGLGIQTVNSIFIIENIIMVYSYIEGIIYLYDLYGELLEKWNLEQKNRKVCSVLRYNEQVYLVLNANKYIKISNNKFEEIAYKQEFFHLNEYYSIIVQGTMLKSFDPSTYGWAPYKMKYFYLEPKIMQFKEIKLAFPMDQNIGEINCRIRKTFLNRPYILESEHFKNKVFMEWLYNEESLRTEKVRDKIGNNIWNRVF